MKTLLFIFSLFISSVALASVGLGGGTSSATSGRIVPALSLSYNSSGWSLSGSAVGFKSGYSYQSSYSLSWLSTWRLGTIFGSDVDGGFGLGSFYTKQGYKESAAIGLKETDDFVLGPSLKLTYHPFSIVFISIEGIFGLRNASNLSLNFQDVVLMALGVTL